MGGRMLKLWPGWSDLSKDDRDHVCSMDRVRQYCVDWCLDNSEAFEKLARFALKYPRGNLKALDKDFKKNTVARLADESVALSGAVEVKGLPAKSSAR